MKQFSLKVEASVSKFLGFFCVYEILNFNTAIFCVYILINWYTALF